MIPRSLLASLSLLVPLAAQDTGIVSSVGIDGYVEVPYDPALVPQGGITIEAWLTYDDSAIPTGLAYYPTIVRQNVARNLESYLLRVNAGSNATRSILFLVRDRNNVVHSLSASFMPGQLLAPTHLAATCDGTGLALYLNGQPLAAVPANVVGMADNGGVLRIGNGDTTFSGFESWSGELDEVRLWPFARSAAEIAATMNHELSAMPSGVLTFNLDNTPDDSSAGLVGMPVGALTYQANAFVLSSRTGMAQELGQSWSTCRAPRSAYGSLPIVGNSAFRLVGTNGRQNGVAAVIVGPTADATGVPVFGVGLHVPTIWAVATVASDSIGTARVPLPVPALPILTGAPLCAQWVFDDAPCGSMGLTASPALRFTIQ